MNTRNLVLENLSTARISVRRADLHGQSTSPESRVISPVQALTSKQLGGDVKTAINQLDEV